MVMDELRRVALFTSGVAELTRHQAERIVKDFMSSGDDRRKAVSDAAKELVKRSQQNRREMLRFIRSEIQNQIENLGVSTKRDLERLERRVARLEKQSPVSKSSRGARTTAKATAARARSGHSGGAAAKKTVAKRTTPRRTSTSTADRPGPGNSAPGTSSPS
jgi:polyhydroxyalkanoate synthesis regulator phasin